MTSRNYRKTLVSIGLLSLVPGSGTALATPATTGDEPSAAPGSPQPAMIDVFRTHHEFTLAQHRSHSSHRSHRSHSSHASHRSSVGGAYSPAPAPAPSRLYEVPPENKSLPDSASAALAAAPRDFEEHVELVQKVQAMLFARNIYTGAMDGVVSLETRDAIIKFEMENTLPVTGRVTKRLVNALQIDPGPTFDEPRYLKTLPGNSAKFKRIVQDVQVVLFVYGYYSDAIDGLIGPKTKEAISAFQRDYGLDAAGALTPETLDALHIAAI